LATSDAVAGRERPVAAPPAASRPRSRGVLARVVRHRADYLYVLPALGAMALVIAYPVYFTVYLSFFNTPPDLALEDKVFVGLANYGRILAAESFHEATWNTLVWTVFSTLSAFVLGFGVAIALNRELLGRGVLRGTLLVPYVISAVAASTSGAGSITAISASSARSWWRSASPTARSTSSTIARGCCRR
jgi:multiple sugar transport system permease protein